MEWHFYRKGKPFLSLCINQRLSHPNLIKFSLLDIYSDLREFKSDESKNLVSFFYISSKLD